MGSLVGVIIPTNTNIHLLQCALESAIRQTCRIVEIIVADDGSTDNTADIARNYGERLKYRCIPHIRLPAVPYNAGLQLT
ncbi:MAG: glycosyltransferase [Bacteroidota bacterium]